MASPGGFDPIEEARRQWEVHELGEPLAMAVTTSIIRCNQVVSAACDGVLKPLDLTFARYELLTLLSFSRAGALPMTKLGDRLMIHPTGITKLVDKLEQPGLVRREPNPDDRRGILVHITDEGRRISKQASALVADVRFGVDLPDGDMRQLIALLRKIRLPD